MSKHPGENLSFADLLTCLEKVERLLGRIDELERRLEPLPKIEDHPIVPCGPKDLQ